jgi:hypothetical protein
MEPPGIYFPKLFGAEAFKNRGFAVAICTVNKNRRFSVHSFFFSIN